MYIDGSEMGNVRIHEQESGGNGDIPPVDPTPCLGIVWVLWSHDDLERILGLLAWARTVCLMLKLSVDIFPDVGIL